MSTKYNIDGSQVNLFLRLLVSNVVRSRIQSQVLVALSILCVTPSPPRY